MATVSKWEQVIKTKIGNPELSNKDIAELCECAAGTVSAYLGEAQKLAPTDARLHTSKGKGPKMTRLQKLAILESA